MSDESWLFISLQIDYISLSPEEKESLFSFIFQMRSCSGSWAGVGSWLLTGHVTSAMIVDLSAMSGVSSIDLLEK